jgi:hypothetical protein
MIEGMNVEQLRKMHQARPFEPFVIYLADGRSLDVDHPELLGFTPSGRTFGVGMPDETIEIVDLLLVTSLKPKSNASSRKSKPG